MILSLILPVLSSSGILLFLHVFFTILFSMIRVETIAGLILEVQVLSFLRKTNKKQAKKNSTNTYLLTSGTKKPTTSQNNPTK